MNRKNAQIILDLEKETKIPAGQIISDLASGKAEWEDLKIINRINKERKRNPNPKTYSYEEAKKFLGL